MKKFILALMAVATISACTPDAKTTGETAAVTNTTGCQNVRGVNDQTEGKIYYTQSHKLYKYVNLDPKEGDRNFCSLQEAKNAGFSKEAPRYFANSTKNLVDCLKAEGSSGTCHNYVMGIYQSLAIYDKVCAGRDISNDRLRSAIFDKTDNDPHTLEVDRYEGTATSFIDAFSCSKVARKG